MASKLFMTFDSFWETFSKFLKVKNYPTYHPCCKVWVSRRQNATRDTHRAKLSWGFIAASMGSSNTDSKALLHAHMLEHGWNTPIKLNFPCESMLAVPQPERPPEVHHQPPIPALPEGAFSLHRPVQPPPSPKSTPAPLHPRDSPDFKPSKRPPATSECSSACNTCKNGDL